MTQAGPTVADNAERHRFEITVGGEVAGHAEYHDRGKRRAFTHTVINDGHAGQGLGSVLARGVLDDARSHGLDVLPFCPFIRGYIARHRDEYVDLVPEGDRAEFDLAG